MSLADATGVESLDVATVSPAFAIVPAAGFVTGNLNETDPAAMLLPSVTTTVSRAPALTLAMSALAAACAIECRSHPAAR